MPEGENYSGLYVIAGLIIIGLFAVIIIKEINQRAKIVEIVRDENGRITQIVEKTM